MIESIIELDKTVLQFITDTFRGPVLDFLMPIITVLGDHGIFLMFCTLLLIIFPKTRKMGFTAALAMLMGFIFGNLIIKNAVARARPYTLEEFRSLLYISELSDWSFPSGHSLASFEVAVSVFAYNKKAGVGAIIVAIIIAFSRLYLVVHFPSDVLAGAIMGTLFAIAAYFIVKALYKRFGLETRIVFPWDKKLTR